MEKLVAKTMIKTSPREYRLEEDLSLASRLQRTMDSRYHQELRLLLMNRSTNHNLPSRKVPRIEARVLRYVIIFT